MQADGVVKASIAFPADEVQSWNSPMVSIEPAWFGGKSCGNFVPLKSSPEQAIKAALEADVFFHTAAKAATEVTEWYILTLTLNPNDLMQAWTTGVLHWSSHMSGIEWWTPLQADGIGELEWHRSKLGPIGLGSWSYTTCLKKLKLPSSPAGLCGGCNKSDVPLWTATPKFAQISYCAECWNDFIKCTWEGTKLVMSQDDVPMQE